MKSLASLFNFKKSNQISIDISYHYKGENSRASYSWDTNISFDDFQRDFLSVAKELTGNKNATVICESPTGVVLSLSDVFTGNHKSIIIKSEPAISVNGTELEIVKPREAPVPGKKAYPDAGKNAAGGMQFQYMQLMAANKAKPSGKEQFTVEEVKAHRKPSDCWVILHGKVYDVTQYLEYHPGGKKILLAVGGKDCTREFNKYHPWVNAEQLLSGAHLGNVKSDLASIGENTSSFLKPL